MGCKASLGCDVHYVTPLDAGVNAGATRAAKVVALNEETKDGITVNLCVFKGHLRDDNTADTESTTFFVYYVKHCPAGTPGTFHFADEMPS